MQQGFSCLIVTGHDIAPQWIVPQGCEYVRLPAWDNLIPSKAAYWGRTPFLDVTLDEAVQMRSAMLSGIVQGFRPDVLFVDHLPLGAFSELVPVLRSTQCLKYLVTRGVQNETEDLQRLVLGGDALEALRNDYDRILSAIDARVFDLADHYHLPAALSEKISSVGYVAPSDDVESREAVRTARGIADEALWVVASAGGGQWGEPLIEACLLLTQSYPNVYFDIVMGPRSRLSPTDATQDAFVDGRVRLHASCSNLAQLNAAADVVITTGGYNSLLEAMQGQARILCIPYRKDHRDEPFYHATLLRPYVDIQVATEIGDLEALFGQSIEACRSGAVVDRRKELQMDGAKSIAAIVLADLEARRERVASSV